MARCGVVVTARSRPAEALSTHATLACHNRLAQPFSAEPPLVPDCVDRAEGPPA